MESRNFLKSNPQSQGSTEPSQDSRNSQDSGPPVEVNQPKLEAALAQIKLQEESKAQLPNPEHSFDQKDILYYTNIRVVMLGNPSSGKSTLLEVLKQNQGLRDDEQRLLVSRREKTFGPGHQEIIGFDADNQHVYQKEFLQMSAKQSWPAIMRCSKKIVQVFDYRGDEKYVTQSISEVLGVQPMYAMIVVGADQTLTNVTLNEYMGLCQAMKIPFMIVIARADLESPAKLDYQLKQIFKNVSIRKDNISLLDSVKRLQQIANSMEKITVPVFQVSSVTLEGIEQLRKFISVLPPLYKYVGQIDYSVTDHDFMTERYEAGVDLQFAIFSHYHIAKGVIIEGLLLKDDLNSGIHLHQRMILGPNKQGRFSFVTILGIQEHRHSCKQTFKGRPVCFLLQIERNDPPKKAEPLEGREEEKEPREGKDKRKDGGKQENDWRAVEKEFFNRRGMGLWTVKLGLAGGGLVFLESLLVRQFEAEIKVFPTQSRLIQPKYQVTFHWRQSNQTVEVTEIVGTHQLKSGESGLVRFRFLLYPEMLRAGARFVLRDGKIVGMGIVSQVLKN